MRKRLLVSAPFGAMGLAAALPIGDRLGLNAIVALIGCCVAGVFLGYLVSIFLDIFFRTRTNQTEN